MYEKIKGLCDDTGTTLEDGLRWGVSKQNRLLNIGDCDKRQNSSYIILADDVLSIFVSVVLYVNPSEFHSMGVFIPTLFTLLQPNFGLFA